jgi:hypothetical protein
MKLAGCSPIFEVPLERFQASHEDEDLLFAPRLADTPQDLAVVGPACRQQPSRGWPGKAPSRGHASPAGEEAKRGVRAVRRVAAARNTAPYSRLLTCSMPSESATYPSGVLSRPTPARSRDRCAAAATSRAWRRTRVGSSPLHVPCRALRAQGRDHHQRPRVLPGTASSKTRARARRVDGPDGRSASPSGLS